MPADRSPSASLAARMGRWSARHRRLALLGWLGFVLTAVVAGHLAGTRAPTGSDGVGESGRADATLDRAFPSSSGERVLIQATAGGGARDAEVRRVTAAVAAQVRRSPQAHHVQAGGVSGDGRSRLVSFTLRGDDAAAERAVRPVVAGVERVGRAHPGVYVGEFGDASASVALAGASDDDLRRAEVLSLPVTLVVLLVAFGALVAAGIPLLLGVSAVAATLGLVALLSHVMPIQDTVSSVVLLVGLAVGVDYTLFYLRREREERRRGACPEAALATAAATAGRAVLVSGLTVIVAMAGMLLAGDRTFVSLGVGSMLVVAVAMLGSITVVPACLAALGDRVERGRLPRLAGRSRRARGRVRRGGAPRAEGAPTAGTRGWSAFLRIVLGRPGVAASLSAGVLVVLALPAVGIRTALPSAGDLPAGLAVTTAHQRLQAAFPGGQEPGVVVVTARDVTAPSVRAGVAVLRRRVAAAPHLAGPVDVSVSADRTVAAVDVPMAGSGGDAASQAGLRELREDVVPRAFGGRAGVRAAVTGEAAGTSDFNGLIVSRAPLIFGFVLGLAFLLLLVTFRSIVVPVQAIVLNLLSVGAAYGVLTWIFQDGHLEGPLGFSAPGYVVSWLPVFLFVILFGLSMDYHVLILSRVREVWAGGAGTDEAVREGVTATAGTVTSAAAVMVAVFAIFATLGSIELKMMGVGLATAILLDATLVRAVLLPATIALLGERTWFLPRWLAWLPPRDGAARPARRRWDTAPG